MSDPKPKSPAEAWDAIRRAADEADLEEILAMTDEELDGSLSAAGGDPNAIGERGAALSEKLGERYARLAWMRDASRGQSEFAVRRAELRARRVPIPRAELELRVKQAANDPRFKEAVAMLFRDHGGKPSTDEELHTLLEHIELLKERVLEKDKGK